MKRTALRKPWIHCQLQCHIVRLTLPYTNGDSVRVSASQMRVDAHKNKWERQNTRAVEKMCSIFLLEIKFVCCEEENQTQKSNDAIPLFVKSCHVSCDTGTKKTSSRELFWSGGIYYFGKIRLDRRRRANFDALRWSAVRYAALVLRLGKIEKMKKLTSYRLGGHTVVQPWKSSRTHWKLVVYAVKCIEVS